MQWRLTVSKLQNKRGKEAKKGGKETGPYTECYLLCAAIYCQKRASASSYVINSAPKSITHAQDRAEVTEAEFKLEAGTWSDTKKHSWGSSSRISSKLSENDQHTERNYSERKRGAGGRILLWVSLFIVRVFLQRIVLSAVGTHG